MKIKLVGCHSTMNEVRALGWDQNMDCTFLDFSFHARPDKLHTKIQEIIDESQSYDLIILTYGRCSNSLVGLLSPKVPLLFPAIHDCIGLLLGSNERHMKMFQENTLTYYFSQGWLDYGRTPYEEYLEYLEKYSEKKAKKLISTLYGRYKKAVLITTRGMKSLEEYRKKVGEIADFFNWEIEEVEGDTHLLDSLLKGKQVKETIYIEPGHPVTLGRLTGGQS